MQVSRKEALFHSTTISFVSKYIWIKNLSLLYPTLFWIVYLIFFSRSVMHLSSKVTIICIFIVTFHCCKPCMRAVIVWNSRIESLMMSKGFCKCIANTYHWWGLNEIEKVFASLAESFNQVVQCKTWVIIEKNINRMNHTILS